METQEKWYSVKEFAGSFGVVQGTKRARVVSVDSVRRWIRKGLLRAFQFPTQSNRRKRKYDTFLISEDERQRFIRTRMTL